MHGHLPLYLISRSRVRMKSEKESGNGRKYREKIWPHPESNWDQRFRKPLLYPFELWDLGIGGKRCQIPAESQSKMKRDFPDTMVASEIEPMVTDIGFNLHRNQAQGRLARMQVLPHLRG